MSFDADDEVKAERELVRRSARGDTDAFERLTVRYYRPVGSYLLRRVGRPDVVEEIFRVFKAARQADTTAPKGKQDPYRFGVEANREALERIIDYSVQQQMIPKKIDIDNLFNDVTRKLV